MNVPYGRRQWMISLGMRNNLLYNDIPHIPVLVEDILIYISFEDYEENGIKSIQTIGELIPRTESSAMLVTLTPRNNSEVPISLKNLRIDDVYVKDQNNTFCAIWEKHHAFKVYGTLKTEESGVILETTHLVPVHDVVGSWNVLKMLTVLARSEYRQYIRTQEQHNVLESQWIKMKEQQTRVVKEKSV